MWTEEKISKFDWHHKTNERAGGKQWAQHKWFSLELLLIILSRQRSILFLCTKQTATKNYFHNKTPTSGGNILIFMLPKHEKELRLLWYTRAKKNEAIKGKKSFFFDIRRRKKIPIGIYLLKKHSLDGLPSKKNNYLIVCSFPSSFFFAFIHKRVESGKFSGCAQENKVLHFIKYSLSCACFFVCLKDFSTMHTTAAVGFWGNITRT